MTWLLLTRKGLYLMQSESDSYLSKISPRDKSYPLATRWFTEPNLPGTLVVDMKRTSEPSAVMMQPKDTDTGYRLADPIIPGGSFNWGEATHGGTRIPNREQRLNIIALAEHLQQARNQIGKPFHITSWFRPEPYNSRAGGVPNSQHLTGKACDFWVDGLSALELRVQLEWWPGGMGTYPHMPEICHLDIGPSRRW